MKPNIISQFDHAGLPCLILEGPFGNPCAYVGIPPEHPIAGQHYDNVDIECHGGLTFGALGDEETRPADRYWYGWDYSHSGDAISFSGMPYPMPGKYWTLEEVEIEVRNVADQFATLIQSQKDQ